MKVEDLRNEDIGMTYINVHIPKQNKWGRFLVYYPEYFNYSFHLLTKVISKAENSLSRSHKLDSDVHSCFLSTYLSFESFISSITKVLCVIYEQDFKNVSTLSLYDKFKFVCKYLDIEVTLFSHNNLIERLNEFRVFRNEIIHDKQFGGVLEFSHTIFSPVAPFLNVVDLVEAYKMVVEVTSIFRFIFEDIDIIPSVLMHNGSFNFWRRIDYVYENYIVPSFNMLLDKHNLTTDLDPVIHYALPAKPKDSINVNFSLKAEPNLDFTPNMNKTTLNREFYNNCSQNIEPPEEGMFYATAHVERIYSDY